jgi:hypothetical protein
MMVMELVDYKTLVQETKIQETYCHRMVDLVADEIILEDETNEENCHHRLVMYNDQKHTRL